jgi:hypothetical protein
MIFFLQEKHSTCFVYAEDLISGCLHFIDRSQARSSLYANTQLRAHRRAEDEKIKSKKNKKNKE